MKTAVETLVKLGRYLHDWYPEYLQNKFSCRENHDFAQLISRLHALNNWHVSTDAAEMLFHLSKQLTESNLKSWLQQYPELEVDPAKREPVLVKPCINYSFAGVREWLCCLVTNSAFVLQADEHQFLLLKHLSRKIAEINPEFKTLFDIASGPTTKTRRYILFTESKNDTVYNYFANRKSLITEPWNTVCVLSGNETPEVLSQLGKDIFMHLGHAPGTLKKIFIPKSFDIKMVIEALEPYASVYQNNKYANNYDYHQSVFLMNRIPFLDNGFLIFKEDTRNDAPVGCLFYEYYPDIGQLTDRIKSSPDTEQIISAFELPVHTIKPGESHFSGLGQYPNGKDIVKFLLS